MANENLSGTSSDGLVAFSGTADAGDQLFFYARQNGNWILLGSTVADTPNPFSTGGSFSFSAALGQGIYEQFAIYDATGTGINITTAQVAFSGGTQSATNGAGSTSVTFTNDGGYPITGVVGVTGATGSTGATGAT